MKAIRIGVDARYLSATPSGIGRHTRGLLSAMFEQAPEYAWHVLVHGSFVLDWPQRPPPLLSEHRSLERPVSRYTVGALGRWIDAQRFDLWHATFPLVPRCRTPLIVTVHDLQPLLCPEWTGERPWPLPGLYRRFYQRHYGRAVKTAKRIMAVSQWTADTIAEQWPEVASKVAVVPNGLGDTWHRETERPAGAPAKPPFVLFVGSTRPNKNIPNLIRAFGRLRAMEGIDPKTRLRLVLVRDRFWAEIERLVEELGLSERVDIVPSLDDHALRGEYRRAGALAFPTTHEGFGLPPLEAMACGCPVVASTHGALPETCGEAAEFVPPDDPESIAAGIARVMLDERRRKELIAKGREQVKPWKWESSARKALNLYREVLE